jgi:hypothetical protein
VLYSCIALVPADVSIGRKEGELSMLVDERVGELGPLKKRKLQQMRKALTQANAQTSSLLVRISKVEVEVKLGAIYGSENVLYGIDLPSTGGELRAFKETLKQMLEDHTEREKITSSLVKRMGKVRELLLTRGATLNVTAEPKELDPLERHGAVLMPDLSKPPHSIDAQESPVVVLVMSSRCNFEQRAAIRESWAKGFGHVLFLVGRRWCQHPHEAQAAGYECRLREEATPTNCRLATHQAENLACSTGLAKEQSEHNDVMMVDVADSYGGLSAKLLAGIYHTVQLVHNLQAVMKIDDDCVLDVALLRNIAAEEDAKGKNNWGIGAIRQNVPVQTAGQWRDVQYKKTEYPPYPQGNKGYVISAAVALALANSVTRVGMRSLEEGGGWYMCENEDAAIGIWLSPGDGMPAGIAIEWSTSEFFFPPDGGCREYYYGDRAKLESEVLLYMCCSAKPILSYGHLFTPSEIRTCWQHRRRDDAQRATCSDGVFEPTTGQCDGLHQVPRRKDFSREQCQDFCCSFLPCRVWQWQEEEGECWVAHGRFDCDPEEEEAWSGGIRVLAGARSA